MSLCSLNVKHKLTLRAELDPHTQKCCWAYYTSFQVGVSVTSLQLVSPKLHDVPVGLLASSVNIRRRDENRREETRLRRDKTRRN